MGTSGSGAKTGMALTMAMSPTLWGRLLASSEYSVVAVGRTIARGSFVLRSAAMASQVAFAVVAIASASALRLSLSKNKLSTDTNATQ